MARDLQQESQRMATRMNMLKLLQEVRGFAQFTSHPVQPRPDSPLMLQFQGLRLRKHAKRKQVIRIDMQEPLDIPQPVRITYLDRKTVPSSPT